ncbi:unnamed protein product, partial [Chrysoparadoxa australica]
KRGKGISLDDAITEPEQRFDLRNVDTSGRDFFDAISAQRKRARRHAAPAQRPDRIKTYTEHKGVEIHIDEVVSSGSGGGYLTFEWMAKSCGRVIGSGVELDKATAARNSIAAAEKHTAQPHRFKVNLCDDGSVVTRDGEYLGTWQMDENDHPSFTPDGETEVLFFEMWVGLLCKKIAAWLEARS